MPSWVFVPVEGLGVELGYFLWGFALGQSGGNHLVLTLLQHLLAHVAHVRDVLHLDDAEALYLKRPAYPVGHEVGAHVPQVGKSVYGRPAGVHPDNPRLQGLQLLRLSGKGVVKSHNHAPPVTEACVPL